MKILEAVQDLHIYGGNNCCDVWHVTVVHSSYLCYSRQRPVWGSGLAISRTIKALIVLTATGLMSVVVSVHVFAVQCAQTWTSTVHYTVGYVHIL